MSVPFAKRMKIKVEDNGNDLRLYAVDPNIRYEDLRTLLKWSPTLRVKYRDLDHEYIDVNGQSDWEPAIKQWQADPTQYLRLLVLDRDIPSPPNTGRSSLSSNTTKSPGGTPTSARDSFAQGAEPFTAAESSGGQWSPARLNTSGSGSPAPVTPPARRTPGQSDTPRSVPQDAVRVSPVVATPSAKASPRGQTSPGALRTADIAASPASMGLPSAAVVVQGASLTSRSSYNTDTSGDSDQPTSAGGAGVGEMERTATHTYDGEDTGTGRGMVGGFQWRKGASLGEGSFGKVYCALDVTHGRMLAVKEMSADTEARKTAIHKEVLILRKMRHPHIVPFLGCQMGSEAVFIFLEFVAGGSIASMIRKYGPLPEPLAQNYTRQALAGIAYLHKELVVHRDIKGDNLLVTAEGVVRVTDFGASKFMKSDQTVQETRTGLRGTIAWMAPEVIRAHEGEAMGRKADVWSLACTVIEMVTGRPPWHDLNPMAALYAIGDLKEDLPRKYMPPGMSPTGLAFLDACFKRDQAARPTAEALLVTPWLLELDGGEDSMDGSSDDFGGEGGVHDEELRRYAAARKANQPYVPDDDYDEYVDQDGQLLIPH